MKIRFGSLVVGAIGKAGGQCIQRHKQQYILRNITVPTQTMTTRSNPIRVTMRYLSQLWSQLTELDQESWKIAAAGLSTFDKWGDPVVISARQAFTKLSMPAARITNSVSTTQFDGFVSAQVEFKFAAIVTSTESVEFEYIYRLNDKYQEFFCLPIRSSSVNPPVYKLKSIQLLVDSSPSPNGLYSKIQNTFGFIKPPRWYVLGYRYASEDGNWSKIYTQKVRAS